MASQSYLLLRHDNGDGTSKDWAVAVIGEAVVVRFGKTGAAMQQREIPRSSWKAPSAKGEADRRIREQDDQGYVTIGTCRFDAKGQVLDVETNPSPDNWVHTIERKAGERRKAERLFFFEIKAASWRAMAFVLDPVVRSLQGPFKITFVGREGLPQAAPVIDGWPLRFDGHSGTGAVNVSGTIDRGAAPGALVFLLALRAEAKNSTLHTGESAVDITIVDATGDPVEPTIKGVQTALGVFGTDTFDTHRTLLTDIGVIPQVVLLGDRVKRRYRF
ncbi:hypothetical protein [Azospirillum sp. sgz302134]